jgi:hypothetical protein
VKILEPADGATVGHDFVVRVDARDDCELAKVKISITPQTLSAESKTPPFEWDLTNISGAQTITVTAIDASGHSATATVQVTAPVELLGAEPEAMPSAGCTVASGAFSLSGLAPSLIMFALFARRKRVLRRRRRVTGALEGGIERRAAGGSPTPPATDSAGPSPAPSAGDEPPSTMPGAAA